MGGSLRSLGMLILAATACLLLADALGWVTDATSDPWIARGIAAGLACLAAGMLLRLFTPFSRELRKDRCVQCGAPTERGHRYCRDHLKSTLNDARDRTRRTLESGRGAKGSGFSSS